jgi:anthranilate/para-aminobenzoate synthase component II
VVQYRRDPEDPKESHDKMPLILPLVTKQDCDQPMISPGPSHGDVTRYQGLTAVLLLLERDVVTIGKCLQTTVSIRDSVCLLAVA